MTLLCDIYSDKDPLKKRPWVLRLTDLYSTMSRDNIGALETDCLYTEDEQKVFFLLPFNPILHKCAEFSLTGVSERTHPLCLSSEE